MELRKTETVKYTLTLTSDEFRDLRLLFEADTSELSAMFHSGALNTDTKTHDRAALIQQMRALPIPEKV